MKLYVKTWCPWCVDAIEWLKQRDYKFEIIDVMINRAAFNRMIDISGQSLTPTLETESGGVLPDFDVGQLENFLKAHSIEP